METSTSVIITREDRQAANILVGLSRGKRYHPDEEEEDVARGDDEVVLQSSKKVDNSNETMMIIKAWNVTKPDPMENLPDGTVDVVERISEPIKKQLTVSDVKEDLRRLMLGKDQVKNKMSHILKASETRRLTEGLDVKVYGPNKVVQSMKFKMWCKGTPVLTAGWQTFVDACDLKAHCDFLHIWMFRHKVTGELCFVIKKARFSTITKPLGKKILDQIN